MIYSQPDDTRWLETLLEEQPRSRLYLHLAHLHYKAGRLEQAQQVLERYLPYHPAEIQGRILQARVLQDMQDLASAQYELQKAIEGILRYTPLFDQLSEIYAGQGKNNEAAKVMGLSQELHGFLEHDLLKPKSGASRRLNAKRGLKASKSSVNVILHQLESLSKAAQNRRKPLA